MTEPTANLQPDDFGPDESWKSEISSRLDSYRTRSKRKLSGEFSMRFNFDGELAGPRQPICVPDQPEAETPEEEPETEGESVLDEAEPAILSEPPESAEAPAESVQSDAPPLAPPMQPPPRPSIPFRRKVVMEANVIEFPRLFPPEPPPPSLAEPVLPTTPRILDAPEIAEPLLETPILEGMRLEELEHAPVPQLELPLQVASLAQRGYAAAVDCIVVLVGSAVFSLVTSQMLPGNAWTKSLFGAIALVPPILWAVYQYLFIVYGARTPGMALTRLAFSTFQGTAPNRRQRRTRMVGVALSCSSLMLGFVWALFDEDLLCWHDRISRTYCFHQKP